MRRRMLWVGDAVVSSGFARCTHRILDRLHQDWDVVVLGLNYRGDPHQYPYPIYPCWDRDPFGLTRVGGMVTKMKPDVVVVQNDPWNLPEYMSRIGNVPCVAFLAVDGKNCRGRGLNGLALAVFWTEFGMKEARAGGYHGSAAVVPLGVDLSTYHPQDRKEARKRLGLPEHTHDAFIVGNVNRNQPRKRLDLTISYFAEWVKSQDIRDAFLYLHVAPTMDAGYDVGQLMRYYGLSNRLIFLEPEPWMGVSESALALTYNAFDVMLSTTQGEGWGLPTMEGMACGIPQIVPDWAAYGEWARDAALLVPCTEIACTPNHINVIGGIAGRGETIQALDSLYTDLAKRDDLRAKGLELVKRPQYRWEHIADRFNDALDEALFEYPAAQGQLA
jgi:D-inositol-3-phosphate glycosyltransferase